jgi:Putative peptidoglycan binding domain/Peptidase M15
MAGYSGQFKGQFKQGAQGKDCAAVGRTLKRIQKNTAIKNSRTFGPAKVAALKQFQKNHKLDADGVYGKKTHEKLAPLMRGYEVLLYKQAKIRMNVIDSWAVLAPGADRAGKSTNQPVFNFVAKTAHIYGMPLVITCGTNHNQFVKGTNRESQHWQGNAADVGMYGASLTKLGRAALQAAGMSRARALLCRGGVYNIGGYNILFNTTVGGNHYNHLHVGV